MVSQTTKIKNGAITLPQKLLKTWRKADVFIEASGDIISIKRLSKPSLTLTEMIDEFQRAARQTKLSKKDAKEAINDVRRKLYKQDL